MRLQCVQMPTAAPGTIGLLQTSHVSGSFWSRLRKQVGGHGTRGSIPTRRPPCHAHAMRLAFFGLPLAALLLLEDGHQVAFCVLNGADALGYRRLSRRMGPQGLYLRGELSDAAIQGRLEDLAPGPRGELVLDQQTFPGCRPHCAVGRGRCAPVALAAASRPRPVLRGDRSGGRGHRRHRPPARRRIRHGGDPRARSVPIDPSWNAWQLATKLDRPSLLLLREIVGRIARGEALPETAQDETQATWAPAPTEDDCALVWSWTTELVLRRIRALAPSPGAFTEIGSELVTILAARPQHRFPGRSRRERRRSSRAVQSSAPQDGAVELVAGEIDGLLLDGAALASIVAHATEKVIV